MKPEQDDRFYDGPPVVQRTYWRTSSKLASDGEYGTKRVEDRTQVEPEKATLVSSLLRDGQHAPCLDIDFPCRLLPSSTAGHFHLYIDKPMSWREYKKLLRALKDAGIIEEGYYKASIRRRGTDLRLPHIKKERS